MRTIEIIRENNFLIKNRNLDIYVDGQLIDTIIFGYKSKKIDIDDNNNEIYIKSGSYYSNKFNLKNINPSKIGLSSQIDNTMYFSIYGLFFLSFILFFLKVINEYIGIAMVLPMLYVAYYQTIGRKSFYILHKIK